MDGGGGGGCNTIGRTLINFMIKFNAKDFIEIIKSSNHDVFRDIKVVYEVRLLLIPAFCKLFTTKNNLG